MPTTGLLVDEAQEVADGARRLAVDAQQRHGDGAGPVISACVRPSLTSKVRAAQRVDGQPRALEAEVGVERLERRPAARA